MTTFGDQLYHMGGVPVGFLTQGNCYHVKPSSGSDSNSGKSVKTPLKTLAAALAKCTANQNDIVFMYAESNTAASTTDYQSSTLDWNKDFVHLIGVNCGPRISHRSRVAFISTYDTASNLFTLSADGCLIQNIEFFAGVAGTNPTGCVYVTGDRNHFKNCHIAGIGNDANDIADAYSLRLNGADENYFEDCVIGVDTIGRGSAANMEILINGGSSSPSSRNIFRGCVINGWCASAGNYVWMSIPSAGSLGRFILFDNCVFLNPGASISGGATMTSGFIVHASANGRVILHNTSLTGCADVNAAADTGLIFANLPIPASATDAGMSIAVIKT